MPVVTSLFYAAASFLLAEIALASLLGTSERFIPLAVITYFVMLGAPLLFTVVGLAHQVDRTWPARNAGPWTAVRVLNAALSAALILLVALMVTGAFLAIQRPL